MGEIMTIEEIKKRFPEEWVIVDDPETTAALEVICGSVLWHGKDRAEIHQKIIELNPKKAAILYLGEVPKDMVFVL